MTWAHIEFRNIDWTARTFDFYAGGQLVQSGMRLPSALASIGCFDIYAIAESAGTLWIDDLVFLR